MIPKEIIWYYIDSHNKEQGPFSAFQMAQWMDCGYFKNDLKCRTSQDKHFHTVEEWKWIAGPDTKNPFLSVLESFDSARWKTFPSLSLDYLKFADTQIPLHTQPPMIDKYVEREHCKRLFDSLPKATATTPSDTEAAQPPPPPVSFVGKKSTYIKNMLTRKPYLDRYRRGSLNRNPTMRYAKYRSRPSYRAEEKAKAVEEHNYKERPALRLIWHNLCVSAAENPWGRRNSRKKFRSPEPWKPYNANIPWTVKKSDNRFSIITAPKEPKMRPTPFPTILTEHMESKRRIDHRPPEKSKIMESKECNTVTSINLSAWPEILSKLSGIKISKSFS